MKQAKVLLLIAVVLLTSVLISCYPGQGQPARGWSGTAFLDGIIYAGTTDGRVVAINASSRDELWSRSFVTQASGGLSCGPSTVAAAIYATPLVDGDSVYVGSYTAHGGRVYALTMTDGEIIREYPIGGAYIGAIVGSPVIDNGTIYVSSSDGRVYALAIPTFTRRWESDPPLADKLWASPSVVGDSLYVSTFDGRIYALSAETGELSEWSFEAEAGFASSPVIYEDKIYVGSYDNSLYAIGIGDSEPLWTFSGGKWFWAAPVVYEGVVYAGCLDGRLYALDAGTGALLWEFDGGDPVVASPVVMDDLLIVADESGTVYVFDLSREPEVQAVPLKIIPVGAAVKSSFCAGEDLVYIRGEDNRIYAVDIDQGWVSWEFALTTEE